MNKQMILNHLKSGHDGVIYGIERAYDEKIAKLRDALFAYQTKLAKEAYDILSKKNITIEYEKDFVQYAGHYFDKNNKVNDIQKDIDNLNTEKKIGVGLFQRRYNEALNKIVLEDKSTIPEKVIREYYI